LKDSIKKEGDVGKPVLDALAGLASDKLPVWMMRQAGRYLPEYRATRAKAGSFLDLCYTPDLAVEVTLQPIRRFGFDAAILFSDILVVPHALGQKVWFVEGEGPRLEPVAGREALARLKPSLDLAHLAPVYETVRRLRRELPAETTLLGFCGAPWTVAGYMIVGQGGEALDAMQAVAARDPDFVDAVVARLVDASIAHLSAQVEAGAEAVQIFESFAASVPPARVERWSLGPIRTIVDGVRARHPTARVIVFARGAGQGHLTIARETGCDAVGLDRGVDFDLARAVQRLKPIQGNLDPQVLVAGGPALDEAVSAILRELGAGPLIFNLGHGILPQTPVAHVERMLSLVRGFSR
jgi:uroporphyrinogen decarboxylase